MIQAGLGGALDEARLRGLFAEVYRGNPRLQEPDYLDWQFRRSPWNAAGDFTLLASTEAGHLGALLGYVPLRVRAGHQVVEGCWTLTWHSFRKDASALALQSELGRRYDVRLHVGNSPDATRIYEALRIPCQPRMPRWVALLDVTGASRLDPAPADLTRLREGSARLALLESSDEVMSLTRFDPDREYCPPWPAITSYVLRTGTYLNWRYMDIPRHAYQALVGPEGQFAVFRTEEIRGWPSEPADAGSWKALRILEWCFDDAHAPAAMAQVLAQARLERCLLADFFCTSHIPGASLERLGFVPEGAMEKPLPALFRPLHVGFPYCSALDLPPHREVRTLDFDAWYITKGDNDLDRVKL